MVLFEKDIEKDYTMLVNEFLKAGMIINVQSMSGAQGELASIDFQDDKYIYKIILKDEYIDCFYNKKIEIRKYKKQENKHCTYWNNDGLIIYEKIYYMISRHRGNDLYTTDLSLMTDCRKKQEERIKNRDSEYVDVKYNKNILKIINNKKGYKSVKVNDIKRVIKYIDKARYTIYIDNKYPLYFSNKG